ncbi:TolB family protein [Micromonospora sp. NBC_01813]|uniref:TolB family protein n=1 Tax=Micromonospora sp. NBC_01813 TaxID=2975988 RepID=UPI002DDA980A|nr:hypothetical protein [Micromonospora sp. NBC_01813]WSA08734.1 hypothetical protein OG958_31950 [Micromonospora sp. NBC_01813]
MDQQTTELVTISTTGTQANSWSVPAGVSDDGRYVFFHSHATNLVPGGTTPQARHIYVRDRLLQTTEIVLEIPPTSYGPFWSFTAGPDGRFITYDFQLPGPDGVSRLTSVIREMQTGATETLSVATDGTPANHATYAVAVGPAGAFVLLRATASNLVSGDTNGRQDVFVRDRRQGSTTLVSVAHDGSPADAESSAGPGSISANGRYVTFTSSATNLVPSDTNGHQDVFVRDRRHSGATRRVSVASDGAQADGHSFAAFISARGRFVAFASIATNLVEDDSNGHRDVFVHDLRHGTTRRVSVG